MLLIRALRREGTHDSNGEEGEPRKVLISIGCEGRVRCAIWGAVGKDGMGWRVKESRRVRKRDAMEGAGKVGV